MAKVFSVLATSGVLTAIGAAKTTIVNASSGNLFITDNDTEEAMADLSSEDKLATLNALYSIEPGKSRSLATGTYNVGFALSYNQKAIICVETKSVSKPAPTNPDPNAGNGSQNANPANPDPNASGSSQSGGSSDPGAQAQSPAQPTA